ncbi:hypothetical protein ES703_91219 [subsurface metagenome]
MDNLVQISEIAKKLDKPSLALLLAFAVFLQIKQGGQGIQEPGEAR